MTKLNNVKSPKETVIAGGTTLNVGQLYVNGDTGVPFGVFCERTPQRLRWRCRAS